jgi:hypothetical protein
MKFAIFFLCFGAVGAIMMAPFWIDRAVVWVLRTFHIFLFPYAIRLAVSVERDTAEWKFGKYEAEHPRIGTIWIGNEAYGLKVKLGCDTEWRPNWIERRIIWDAVDRALSRSIQRHLDKTLPA